MKIRFLISSIHLIFIVMPINVYFYLIDLLLQMQTFQESQKGKFSYNVIYIYLHICLFYFTFFYIAIEFSSDLDSNYYYLTID